MSRPASTDEDQIPTADLRAYVQRVGYDGPLTPTLETLTALVQRHVAAIPFEAFDVLLGRGIDLAPAAVDAKLLSGRRGGYCFEHNGLFKRVLEAVGFAVEGLLGRVNWMALPDAPLRPTTHMALRVTIEGVPWLADVGFGSCVPSAPLRLDSCEPHDTPHEAFRLVPVAGATQLEALVADTWQPAYRFSDEPRLDVDYELANWYTATHPSSIFRQQLIVTRTTPEARHILAGGRLTVRTAEGATDHRLLTAEEIERELTDRFLLQVEPEWRPLIERASLEARLSDQGQGD